VAKESPAHPTIAPEIVELWLSHKVTRIYLEALGWKSLDIRDALGAGKLTDSSNADLSHANTHHALGQQDAFKLAGDPMAMLEFYELITPEEPEPDGDE